MQPQRLGRYHVLSLLATGGMAEVYLARLEGLGGFAKRVVVKRTLPHLAQLPDFVQMFLNEARLAAQLDHPNIVQLFDLGQEGPDYFVAMEYVDGLSLHSLIHTALARRELLHLELALKIISQVLEALAYAHEAVDERGQPFGLIHRDVSPENVLLSRAGAVKLADFGLARAANHPRITQTGGFKGKLHYLAPEMLHGHDFDQRVDLFSTGVVLYEALTGIKPFDAPTPNEILDAVLNRPVTPVAMLRGDVPVAVQMVLDRALARDPARRYPSARAMQQDIERVLLGRNSQVGLSDIGALVGRLLRMPAPPPGVEPTFTPSHPNLQQHLPPTLPPASRQVPLPRRDDETQRGLPVFSDPTPVPGSLPKTVQSVDLSRHAAPPLPNKKR